MSFLTATTLIYTNGAGITAAAGTRLTLKALAGGITNCISCFGKGACTPSHLGGLVLPVWELVPALLPGWGTNTGHQGKSGLQSFLAVGVNRWSHHPCFLSGNWCLHSFLAGGLTLPVWERVPALLPGWGTNTACLGKSACTPSWLGG